MSSVLSRFQKISAMEFYRSANALRSALTNFVMDERYVPKKWRFVFSVPICDMLDNLMGHLIAANNAYPYSPEMLAERKRNQKFAIDDCLRLWDKLQHLICTLYSDTTADHPIPGQLEAIGNMLDRTETLISAWKRSTKLITPSK